MATHLNTKTISFELSKAALAAGHMIWWTVASLCLSVMIYVDPAGENDLLSAFFISFIWGTLGGAASALAWRRSRKRPLSYVLFWSAVMALGWLAALLGLLVAFGDEPLLANDVASNAVYMVFVMASWTGVAVAARAGEEATEASRRELRAVELAREAKEEALMRQLKPHFLFNALNSVCAAVDENPASAQEMLADIAAFLDDTLHVEPKDSEVETELRRINLYVAIQRTRFEENLVFSTKVEQPAMNVAIPPLILQPLVENAVKHGMETASLPLRVDLEISVKGERLRFEIVNDGHLNVDRKKERDERVGLDNVRRRLEARYFQKGSLSLEESKGRVRVVMEVPR